MKKIFAALSAIFLLLCSCSDTAGSSAVTSESDASESSEACISSGNASSQTMNARFIREIDGENYFDVSAAAAASPRRPDDSEFFPEPDGFVGYYVEKSVYTMDADTMRRVLKYPFKGDGAIKWTRFHAEAYTKNPDLYDGVLPISRMNDPLYVSMCVPNEQHSFMDTNEDGTVNYRGRVNASPLYAPAEKHRHLMTIGAIYLNPMKDLPVDATVTLCFGRMTLAVCTEEKDWQLVSDMDGPSDLHNIYYMPWGIDASLCGGKQSYRLSSSAVQWVDDHYEVTLSAQDFYCTEQRRQFPAIKGAVLHFWGAPGINFEDGSKLKGIAGSYTVWVKESEYSEFLTADIGADLRDAEGYIDQAYTGVNFVVTDTPRVVFGHNVGPKNYDRVMDSETVQQMLGLK